MHTCRKNSESRPFKLNARQSGFSTSNNRALFETARMPRKLSAIDHDNPPMHLLIPFAASHSPECRQALATLKLPNLDKLLRKLRLADADTGDENTLSPPHERALAAAQGIGTADGELPWGAWHALQAGRAVAPGEAWGVITPCHWAVQTNHIILTNPKDLNLSEEESRALMAAMNPYFAEDGITLMYDTPTRWLARGEVFAGLATASPDRVIGRPVDDWIPKGAAAKGLRRLQQEMQMLLYTHALTEVRSGRGLLAVNSFWVSGTGALPLQRVSAGPRQTTATHVQVTVPVTLRDAAVREDWAAWAEAWQAIDANQCAALLAALASGGAAALTLCGERNAQRFEYPLDSNIYHKSSKNGKNHMLTGVFDRISSLLRPQLSNNILSSL